MYNSQGQVGKQTPGIEDAHLKPAGVCFGLPLNPETYSANLCGSSMLSFPPIFDKHLKRWN